VTSTPASEPRVRHDGSVVDPSQFPPIQQRTIFVLRCAQIPGQAAVAGVITVLALLVGDMFGSDRLAGTGGAAFTLGSALMAPSLAAFMRRRGRRSGLALAFAVGSVGCVVATVGGQLRWVWLVLAGMVLFGGVQAATLQGRFTAADLAAPGQGPRAIAAVVWFGTLGAVFGPLLTPQWKALAPHIGLDRLVGPFAFSAVLAMMSAGLVWWLLRPDPLVVSGGLDPNAQRVRVTRTVGAAANVIRRSPAASLGLASMVVAQVTMTGVMTMTPPHMKDHGHTSTSPYVIAFHIAGMYAFAPLVGRFVERVDPTRAVVVAGFTLSSGTITAVLGGYQRPLIFVGLFLLGLGWNVGLIAGSSMVTSSVPADVRVEVQGTADLVMSTCGGLAAFGSGLVKHAFGFHLLSNVASLLALALVCLAVSMRGQVRRPSAAA
jgi:MFS family permease